MVGEESNVERGRETVEKQYIETGKKGGMDEGVMGCGYLSGMGQGVMWAREGRRRGGLEMSEAGWQGVTDGEA